MRRPYQLLAHVFFLFLFLQASFSLSSSSHSATQLCSHNEAAALIQFKSSFSIDETASLDCAISYPKTNSWKEGTDCCKWDGVTCDDKNGKVIELDLSCSQLYGRFPSNSSLFLLSHLQKLNLAFNHFNFSKIPADFGRFTSLVSLNLCDTSFSGKVPYQLSYLSKLVSLDLSLSFYQPLVIEENTLEGLVHNLTKVRELFFDGIKMSSINPNVFLNLSFSLRSLSLHSCDLRGKFPKDNFDLPNLKLLDLGYNLMLSLQLPKFNRSSHLEYFDISHTSFSAKFAEFIDLIENLSSLKDLSLSNTPLFGGLPGSIGNLVSLKHLDLSGCNLSGSIPSSLGNLSQLIHLDLSLNHFSAQIRSPLTNLTQLEVLYVDGNQLKGSIPESWFFAASSLKFIDLSKNQLSGLIPLSISQLANLIFLDLSSNNLSGSLEFGTFSKLQNLQYLSISSNHLSFNANVNGVDYTWPNLQYLYLSSCNISEFPQFLRGSKNLEILDLSNNKIYGEIPKWMWDVGKDSFYLLNLSHNFLTKVEQVPWNEIQILDLSSNLIHGDLPIPPSTTKIFFISNNNLSGQFSSLLCNVSSLQILDLSHNNLGEIIPQCFGNLGQSVWTLNLQMNKFSGIIPSTFAEGCKLKNLNLNGNQLEGRLTRSILNCTDLEVLDLGNNKLNDTFPHWLGSLPQLQVLVLQSNQMHGPIYHTGANLFPKIQIFDLSSNYFIGPLPMRYIKNFKAMRNLRDKGSELSYMGTFSPSSGDFYSYSIQIAIKGVEIELVKIFTMLTSIDLSSNKFEGNIPKVIGKLNSLKGLNLSHNNLSGCIPTSIGNLTNLEWLDLSSNKLVGTIPESLLDLTFLSVFNASENQLGGRIPEGKQFNTFGNDSYEGNKGLCGFPVSKGCSSNESPSPQLSPSNSPEKKIFDFGWKVVLIGYGCGVIFGLAVGYVVFRTKKPIWLVSLVEDSYPKRQRKSKIGNRRGGGRRS